MNVAGAVGHIVHFYNFNLSSDANNGIGVGPYAAIVTQAFNGGYLNLKILPYGNPWDEGSVQKKGEGPMTRYWDWPPPVRP